VKSINIAASPHRSLNEAVFSETKRLIRCAGSDLAEVARKAQVGPSTLTNTTRTAWNGSSRSASISSRASRRPIFAC